MLTVKTFLNIPQYFEPREGSKRNYYRSIKVLEPTIWWINYSELDIDDNFNIDVYDLDEQKLIQILAEFGANIIDYEIVLKRLKYTPKNKRDLKYKILDFKIHSETDLNDIHYVSIGILSTSKYLHQNDPIKVYCSCPDFRYTFSYVLYKHQALLYEEEFPPIFKQVPPRVRNPYQIPFACKHVYTVLWHMIKHPTKIQLTEESFYKYNKIRPPEQIRPKLKTLIMIQEIKRKIEEHYKKYRKMVKDVVRMIKEQIERLYRSKTKRANKTRGKNITTIKKQIFNKRHRN